MSQAHFRTLTSTPPAPRGRERIRAEQRRLFLSGGALFAGYYCSFWLAGIYTLPSLVTGLSMALGLIAVGQATPHLTDRRARIANVFVAVLLGVGATTSAAFSDGSRCMGFHTIWALPLIYGLFVRDDVIGSATIAGVSLLGGLGVLWHDEVGTSSVAQWLTLSASAGLFAFVKQVLERRNLLSVLAENEQAQSRLAVADRMASIGMLAAGVAHEINNPMSYVMSNVEFAAARLQALQSGSAADKRELNEALGDAVTGCERISTIVRTLSRLSRTQGSVSDGVDLNKVLGDIIRLSHRELDSIARVSFAPGDVRPVRGDESRLGQVFLNLLVNGAHAVEQRPEGPRTIEVRTCPRAEAVVVEISDTGCGIPPENLARIFDPFFTTKPSGKGTGLGLALCAEIVAQHAGTVEVESTPGQGSVFRVVLPASVPLATPAAAGQLVRTA